MAKWTATLKIKCETYGWTREVSQDFPDGSHLRHGLMEGFERTMDIMLKDIEALIAEKKEK